VNLQVLYRLDAHSVAQPTVSKALKEYEPHDNRKKIGTKVLYQVHFTPFHNSY